LLDNIADVVDLPAYDEYDDYYDNELPELPTKFPLSENVLFQSIMRAINLHIIVTEKKLLNQLKEILYLYAFLHLNF
jgi:hypothetical protein